MKQLDQKTIKEFLHYNPDTGILTWRERDVKWFKNMKQYYCNSWNTRYANKTAGNLFKKPHNGKSYLQLSIFNKWSSCHRIIWLYVHGCTPSNIDHINGDGTDNRLCNLREVTLSENSRNMKRSSRNNSGVTGVSWQTSRGKWYVTISAKGKRIFVGRFDDFDNAVEARKKAEILHNYHPNHGKDRPS